MTHKTDQICGADPVGRGATYPSFQRFNCVLALAILAAACSVKPVLYPNAHLKEVGDAQAHQDIAECRQMASQYMHSDAGKQAAGGALAGGAVGGAAGAAGGAILGHAARGAAVGAAAGAAGGLVHGIIRGSEPSAVYKNFVNHCLRDRGYDVVGWQ